MACATAQPVIYCVGGDVRPCSSINPFWRDRVNRVCEQQSEWPKINDTTILNGVEQRHF